MEQNAEAIETTPDAKGRGQDVLGLLMWALGAWFAVSIFLSLRDREPSQGLLTAPVVGLIDAIGSWPGLVFSVGLAVLGTALFLRARGVEMGRHLLGLVGLTLGVALAVGAFLPAAGGLVGNALPATLPGMPGGIAALVLGVLVLIVSVWLTWLGTLTAPLGPSGPSEVRSVRTLPPEDAEGVSTAEAAALLRTPEPLPEAAAFPGGAADIRLRGGVPAGTRPLDEGRRRTATFRPEQDITAEEAAEYSRGTDAVAPEPAAPEAKPLEREEAPRSLRKSPDRARAARVDLGASLADGVRSLGGAASVLDRGGSPVTPAWELAEEGSAADDGSAEEDVLAALEPAQAEELAEESVGEALVDEVPEAEAALEEDAGEPVLAPKEWEQAGLFDETQEPGAEAEEAEDEEEDEELAELEEDDEEEEYEDDEEEDEDEEGEYAEADEDDGEEEEDEEDEDEDRGEEEYAEAEEEEDEEEEDEAEEVELVPVAQADPGEPAAEAAETPSGGGASERTPRQLLLEAGCLILEENRVAVSMLERRFELDFDQACGLLDELQNEGLIGPYKGGRTRDILLDREEWEARVGAGASSSA